MTALDALVLILVGGTAVRGAMRGFTTEVLTLLSWFLGIAALRFLFEPVNVWFDAALGDGALSSVCTFILIFGGVVLATRLLAYRLGIGVKRSIVGPVDRVLGFGFGALKGLLAVTLIFLFANLATDLVSGPEADRPDWIADAETFPLLNASSRAIVDFAAERAREGN